MAKEGKRGNWQSLAEEITTDILSRLPAETVMVCRCVCKAWNSLLNHHYFLKVHLEKSKTNTSSSHILIETADHWVNGEDSMKRYFFNVESHSLKEIPVYPYPKDKICPTYDMTVVSHLDGLICFLSFCINKGRLYVPVVVYNPLIKGDYVSLPKSNIFYQNGKARTTSLGFDHSINKYKVVQIMTGRFSALTLGCQIITIEKHASWRKSIFPYSNAAVVSREGICHRGSIYWMIRDADNRGILEFDLAKEVFSMVSFSESVKFPTYCDWERVRLHSLGEYTFLTEEENWLAHIWQVAKQNSGSKVVGYRTMKLESLYKHTSLRGLVYLNSHEDLLLLRTNGGFEPRRSPNGGRVRTPGTHFTFYRPNSTKNNRSIDLPNLSSLFPGQKLGNVWCFKPSLVSIKQAMLN